MARSMAVKAVKTIVDSRGSLRLSSQLHIVNTFNYCQDICRQSVSQSVKFLFKILLKPVYILKSYKIYILYDPKIGALN